LAINRGYTHRLARRRVAERHLAITNAMPPYSRPLKMGTSHHFHISHESPDRRLSTPLWRLSSVMFPSSPPNQLEGAEQTDHRPNRSRYDNRPTLHLVQRLSKSIIAGSCGGEKSPVKLIIGNSVQPHSKIAKDATLEWGTHAVELRLTGQPKATVPTYDVYLAGIRSNLPELSV
jgi:hypothetical protein